MRTSLFSVVAVLAACSSNGPQRPPWDSGADLPTGKVHEVRPGESIQAALDKAQPGDEVRLLPGTYRAEQPVEAMVIVRADKNGVAIRGKGNGPADVVIDGNKKALHVIYLEEGVDRRTIIENLTVTGGNTFPDQVMASGWQSTLHPEYAPTSDFHLDGAGLMLFRASPTIRRCRIVDNRAKQAGGGVSVFCPDGESCPKTGPLIVDSELERNSVVDATGGAIDVAYGSRAEVRNCLFVDNAGWGTVAILQNTEVTVESCTIVGSKKQSIAVTTAMARISNTIVANGTEAALHLDVTGADVKVSGLIAWNNQEPWTAPASVGTALDADPLFVAGPRGAYYLSQRAAGQDRDSPGLDAGTTTAAEAHLDRRTTRSDGREDEGKLDLGYHYAP